MLSDVLDLVHRLPAAWAKVEALQIAPWRARRLAQATRGLSKEAAAHVDRELAPVLDSCGPTRIDRVVQEARARFDPVDQANEEDAQRAGWGIRLVHGPSGRYAGTSWLEITGDTPTLTRFHDQINAIAHDLLDPDDLADSRSRPTQGRRGRRHRGPRPRSHRIGSGAPDEALPAPRRRDPGRPDGRDRARRTPRTPHHRSDQAVARPDPGHHPPGAPHRPRRCRGPARPTGVDARAGHPARPDLRLPLVRTSLPTLRPRPHRAFVEMDDGGPPGQTRPDNLAPLCRRHHRAKTHAGWHYRRNPDGTYTWHSPHGRTTPSAPDGTVRTHD